LIGTSDHEEAAAVAVEIVADDPPIDFQRKADVVKVAYRVPSLPRSGRHRKAGRLAFRRQSRTEVQTADIKCQLRAQHPEETQNVIVGLGNCIGN
jgi:hypothetical protein